MRIHRKLEPNKKGRDFLIGDLHGMWHVLKAHMKKVKFDRSVDRIVSVGDLVDRGPESVKCLKLLEKKWFFATLGNHEEMMIDVCDGEFDRKSWYANGGKWAKNISDKDLSELAALALKRMPLALTLELKDGRRIGLTHAECPVDDWTDIKNMKIKRRQRRRMIWGRTVAGSGSLDYTDNIDLTVHGHTVMKSPTRLGDALFIDTGCCYGGKLTFVQAEDAFDLK